MVRVTLTRLIYVRREFKGSRYLLEQEALLSLLSTGLFQQNIRA